MLAAAEGVAALPSGIPRAIPVSDAQDAAAPSFDFDLPAQPLALALNRFADISGRSALFSSTLVAGRASSPVRGRHAPLAALQLLLEGSGLEVEEVSAGRIATFVLKPASAQALAAAAATRSSLESYDSLVQARVWEALCADPRTAQGGYRSLLRFRVDSAGRIHRAQLLGGTGDDRRDAVLVETLERVRIDRPPPPEMSQPLAMLIVPEMAGAPTCAGGTR